MTRRDWLAVALYALGMAFLAAGFALGSDACLAVAIGLVIGAVLVPLLDGPVIHVHVNVYGGDGEGGDESWSRPTAPPCAAS